MEKLSLDQLSDDVLCCIISLLSFDEAVRTSILSKRWKILWKNLTILDFHSYQMINPLSNLKKNYKPMRYDLDELENHARKYREIVHTTIRSHLSELTSCRFNHFSDDVDDLVKLLLEKNKRLSSLILECCYLPKMSYFQRGIFSNLCSLELTNYGFTSSVSSAFECCEKLKTLKLEKIRMEDITIDGILKNCLALEKLSLIESRGFEKLKIQKSSLRVLELGWLIVSEIDVSCENLQILTLDSLICKIHRFQIYSQDLRVLSSFYSPLVKRPHANSIHHKPLETHVLLGCCHLFQESQPTNIFRNLSTLAIELDLNNIKECISLGYTLKLCYNLNTLEITLPVSREPNSSCTHDFPMSLLWECYNFFNKLKVATVRGFTGKEQEVDFVKHLITRANMVERIYIICDSSIMEEATSLLLLKRASVYRSIILKSERRNHIMIDARKRLSHFSRFFYLA